MPAQFGEGSGYGGMAAGGGQSSDIGFSGFERPPDVHPTQQPYTQPQLPISTLPPSYGYPPRNAQAPSHRSVTQPAAELSAAVSGVPGDPLPVPSGFLPYDSKRAEKVAKLCKYTTSALNYEDVKTAVDCLTKALNLLTTGREEP